ncbi:MAG: M6 family metalloprotease domain-containing protein, partial [Planctomycetota bacterium]
MILAMVLLLAGAGDPPPPGPRRPAQADSIDARLPSPEEAWLGVEFALGAPPRIRRVEKKGPAWFAGLRAGDHIVDLQGVEPPDGEGASWIIRVHVPGERIRVRFLRDGERGSVPVVLGRRPGQGALWRKSEFRLAVIPVEFSDVRRPGLPDDLLLDRQFFSRNSYEDRLERRRLHGSLRDYFHDQSYGRLRLTGRVFPTVHVPARKRLFVHQPMGAGPDSLFARALRSLHVQGGLSSLEDFDGIAFLYPGAVGSPPRRALWPHRAMIRVQGRLLPYFVKNMGTGPEPEPIGVLCHEFGHLLGLPDQYGVAHRTGVGDWCLMSIGHRGGAESGADRPFGLCAWCRTVLGWSEPVAVDPAVPQALALAAATAGPGEVFLVPGEDPGEAFLLENRRRTGWDAELPGDGLLVWRSGAPLRVGDSWDRPYLDLVEAHGMTAPDASMLRPDEIPFPGPRGGSLAEEIHRDAGVLRLREIREHPGGLVTFRIGDRERLTAPPARVAPFLVDAEGFALLRDPITGARARVFMGRPED